MNQQSMVESLNSMQSVIPSVKGILQRSAIRESPVRISPAVHEVLREPGRPLDAATRAFFGPWFGHDFSNVRVHTGMKAVESVAACDTRAYAAGDHIAFAPGQYAPSSQDGRELLFHELFHVAQNSGKPLSVSCWNKEEHHLMTKALADTYRLHQYRPTIVDDPLFGSDQFFRIVDSSFNMDTTAKRILVTGPRFVLKIKKGEGPEHGEDGDYQNPDIASARKQNVRLQEDLVMQSIDQYRRSKGETRTTINGKVQVTPTVRAMFKLLGDACHVAQDRGAHGEGTANRGHEDPRTKQGWDPDNPRDNPEGYRNALENTREVFRMWTWEATMTVGPTGVMK